MFSLYDFLGNFAKLRDIEQRALGVAIKSLQHWHQEMKNQTAAKKYFNRSYLKIFAAPRRAETRNSHPGGGRSAAAGGGIDEGFYLGCRAGGWAWLGWAAAAGW